MHDGSIPGPWLDRLHPHVLGEIRLGREVLVPHLTLGRDAKLLRNFKYDVWLADAPAVGERGCGRLVFLLAVHGPAVNPRRDGVNLLSRETSFVGEMAKPRVGTPRRHSAQRHDFADHVGPIGSVVKG